MHEPTISRYRKNIERDFKDCRLKILQTISLDAPGSERLVRTTSWYDLDSLARYDRAVGLFLFCDDEYHDTQENVPKRSLVDKKPKNLYSWNVFPAGTKAFVVPPERLVRFAERINPSNPLVDPIDWKVEQSDKPDSVYGEKEWTLWSDALSSQFDNGDWTCWVSFLLKGNDSARQYLPVSAYAVGSGGFNSPDERIKLVHILQTLLAEQAIEIHEKEIERQSRSASLSQVLSRTMSHNLGSHSLNAFATEDGMRKQFEEVEYRKRHHICLPGRICSKEESCVTQAAPCLQEDLQFAPVKRLEAEELSHHRRELLARYNNYLRERMDFLADITTAVPAFETRTHLVHDLLKGYADNHLLTTTIAGSPDFDYRWKPELGDGKDDILVSIPSDVLGRHAFYVILENVVRNSSKHGAHQKGTPVTYSVEVTPMTGKHVDMLKVTIKDDKCRPTQAKAGDPVTYCKEHDSLSQEEKARMETVQSLKAKRNTNINDKVLKEGRVREGAWGILEMKACAAYLRRIALEELDDEKYHAFIPNPKATDAENAEQERQHKSQADLPLLEAMGDASGFGYAFYLSRPKDVMVIGEKVEELFPGLDAKAKESLPEFGIGLMGQDELEKRLVINHGLLVYHKTTDEGLQSFIKCLLADPNAMPHEILVVGGSCKESVKTALAAQCDHPAHALASRTLFAVEDMPWPGDEATAIGKWANTLRRLWLLAKLEHEKKQVLGTNTKLYEDTDGSIYAAQFQVIEGAFKLNVDYAPHAGAHPFYVEFARKTTSDPTTTVPARAIDENGRVVDHDAQVLGAMKDVQNFVLRYPSALDRVMSVNKERMDALTMDRLSMHHMAYWLSNTAVIDERIQESVHASTYSPQVKPGEVSEVMRVKHMLDISGVFVPYKSALLDLHSKEYTMEMWWGLRGWLEERRMHLSYVYVHLSVLEKFASQTVIKSVEEGLAQLRAGLPHARLIIVSGRGKPPSLPKGELFVSYSALNQYLTQPYQRSPVLLSILSHSARRLT